LRSDDEEKDVYSVSLLKLKYIIELVLVFLSMKIWETGIISIYTKEYDKFYSAK